MKDITKSEIYQKALFHTTQHASLHDDAQERIHKLNQNQGNIRFSIQMLYKYAYSNAMVSWVRDKDLTIFKEWSYLSAKLERMVLQFEPLAWFPAYRLFSALLCDNHEILDWYRQHRISYDKRADDIKDRDNPKQPAFHGYQMILALNHEWDRLGERCEQILSIELKKTANILSTTAFIWLWQKGIKPRWRMCSRN